MSLKDPDDEYEELVPERNNFLGKSVKKYKTYFILLIVGILLGILIQLFWINPLINNIQGNTCQDCTYSKELLNQENECLYSLLPDKNASQECAAQKFIEKQNTIAKDYNEESE